MRALVRPVPASFLRCIRRSDAPIDLDRARDQHAAYVLALDAGGVAVTIMPALDDAPDSVFVEDPVVILDRGALLTRPGAKDRRLEGPSIREYLPDPIHHMSAPATLDGGDVLRLGQTFYVGLSERSNEAGAEQLGRFSGLEVVSVKVQSGLHLKSAVTAIGDRVIGLFDRVDRSAFPDPIDAPEEMGGNVLDLGTCVLVSAAAPKTAELLSSMDLDVRTVDVGEFHLADGALTCLSIRVPG